MVSQSRALRISQRIKEDLAELLLYEVSDPRLAGVFITYVKVDRELSFASVFISALEGVERESEIIEGLSHAAGFLRRKLAQSIDIRSFPQLRFNWDPIPENAERVDKILSKLKSESEENNEPGNSN
ncbi:MAG: 30S ribosome-binding factor RbfA [Chloroflexi bacterium]|jgi:ribosome-binding factor A|nr:30S ribosome-binding factor RbfA [Chloroflexota bacterium]MBT3671135.1 30S ribosome-binding factor RbfA [Chloroflexota bacterium]MBT4004406.1 30S ribosome-binding factor RbfA [Chloroflexota bacterium]MBT4304406.1 30S ribosome-binding factor RbfA [Chloroflexota bacterium]MBT4534425.1 30S ribosome-binding factor RbfA [Chloroflexota bacterium]